MSLFFVFQIVLRRRFRQYEGVQHKPRTQPETGDEAVQGGVAVVGGSGVGEVREAFLLLAGEMLSQPVLVLADRLQLVLDTLVILKATVLRVDIAVIELLNKAFHIVSPCIFLGETRALSA